MKTYIKIILISMALLTSACTKKELIRVPVYQEIVINDPTPTPAPNLHSPKFKIMSVEEMRRLASDPDNSKTLYAVIPVEMLSRLLDDQLAQYEYAKAESLRADFYKDSIHSFNGRMRELNSNAEKNP